MSPLKQEVHQEDGQTSKRATNRTAPQVYRILTPSPSSGDKSLNFRKSTAVFELNSDSSDQSDILVSNFYFR